MTQADPQIEALAAQRLAADEERITGQARRRQSLTLSAAWREFWRHPSPWLISTFLVASVIARIAVGRGSWWELLVPVALIALFPVIEWVIHVAVLHWRPRTIGPLTVDSLLAREHRAHHADPRDLPLVFIPWRVLVWLLPTYVVVAWLVTPNSAWMLTLLVSVYGIKAGYEWTHYLVHSDHRPRSRWYRSVWRNHRLHHYKNEHYWFTVTSAGTADRLFGTYPADASAVPTSPTVKRLHDLEETRG
ncbi:sterol desaturase family protein [Nocardioides anomalus]|uniref:Sterol desaturase family protein n=1 Tax=Nocardioides anomalus TaxID=2712223 RepID=A0A6G6WIT0_9ACTN|nr:sterol desaturase family protein [Nocardioides anomalus]QIG45238.1 sterol desaturase family protein [Nocardioides anomalus]